jgi:hypothetical protein
MGTCPTSITGMRISEVVFEKKAHSHLEEESGWLKHRAM